MALLDFFGNTSSNTQLYKNKRINQPAPSHWVGIDTNENYRCICWVEIDKENVIYVKTGMRRQLYSAVDVSDLLSMLAIFDLDKKLKGYFSGNEQPVPFYEFDGVLNEFCSKLQPRSSATCGSFGYPVF
ncbi:MAG: hypothetical protein ACXWT0_16620 [Methylobacter sp.]